MERIIVTVKRQQEAQVRDLEVPAAVQVAQLVDMIAAALHWDRDSAGGAVRYQIEAEPPGRLLQAEETLTKAGVRDGAWLTFIPTVDHKEPISAPPVESADASPAPPADTQPPPPKGPVLKWESLFPDGRPEPGIKSAELDEASEDDPPDSPFVWKEIDL